MERRRNPPAPSFRIVAPERVGYTFARAAGSIDVNAATKPDDAQVLAARAFADGLRGHGPCTGYQRLALGCELRAQGYPMTEVTPRHKQLFEGAGLTWANGADIEAALQALTRAEASHLLRQLKGSA